MKVSELIESLENVDPDLEVHYAYPSGDHWRTQLAPKVRKVADGEQVKHSVYHDMPERVDVEEEDDADPPLDEVVILS